MVEIGPPASCASASTVPSNKAVATAARNSAGGGTIGRFDDDTSLSALSSRKATIEFYGGMVNGPLESPIRTLRAGIFNRIGRCSSV